MKQITPDDLTRGYVVCDCGQYAHVLSARVAALLPEGYLGELCAECGQWVAAVAKLPEARAMVEVRE